MLKGEIETLREQYGPTGFFIPGSWKSDSDRLYTPANAVNTWRTLNASGLVKPEEKMVFLSTGANIPTHERAIWQYVCSYSELPNLFIAGDFQDLRNERDVAQATNPGNQSQRFEHLQLDAEHLPLKSDSVNVIWDRKAWLWHCTADFDSPYRLEDSFMEYRRVLEPGGIIVLDNITSIDETQFRQDCIDRVKDNQLLDNYAKGKKAQFRPSDLFTEPFELMQFEPSTVGIINGTDPFIWDRIERWFDIIDQGEGIERVRILIKN